MKVSHSIFYDVLNNQKEKDEGWGAFVLALSDDIIATFGGGIWALCYATIFN